MQALEYWGQISYLKGGINFSEQVTCAGRDPQEVLTPELGSGFEGVLARRANVLTGTKPVSDAHSWDASALEYVKVYRGAESKADRLTLRLLRRRHRFIRGNQRNTMASEKVTTLTDTNFDQSVIKSAQPVLVDFWAEWCGPCKRLGPTIDELATDYDGRVTIGKLNVDDNPGVAGRFSIRGIPTLLLFKGGEIVEQVVGLADKDSLKKMIDKHV